MLTITPTAATVLDRARTEKGASQSAGVRFFATQAPDSERPRLAFTFVETPMPDDTVVTESPMKAYVAADVETLIGDVTVDTKEEGDQLGLVVKRSQAS